MIDNDTEYLALKKQCNNGLYQFSQPSGYDKSKWKDAPDTVNCPRWIFSEEYALTQKDFKLRWHTPYVIDGGISFHAEIHGDSLKMKTIQDGIVELGVIDRKSLKLERFRNRMICIQVDAKVEYEEGKFDDGPGKINVSFFDDSEYILWQVQYFDYIANDETFIVVKARSKNEAKVIAWNHSCYRNHNIDPETFKAWEYDGPYIISRDPKLSDDVMKTQILLCEEYDKKYG